MGRMGLTIFNASSMRIGTVRHRLQAKSVDSPVAQIEAIEIDCVYVIRVGTHMMRTQSE